MPIHADTPVDYEVFLKELAHHLAALRQRSRRSGVSLARELGTTQASVSRIETGLQRPSPETVIQWARITGASSQELQAITGLYESLTHEYISFRQQHRRGEGQRKALAEESTYDHIRVVQTALVPGLLQIPEYARHVFELRPRQHTAEEIAESIETRTKRQEQLRDGSRKFDFLIFEQALSAMYAPAKVMQAQFDHVLHVSSFKNVWIGIVPIETRLPAIPIVSFQLFGDDYVVIETPTRPVTVDGPAEVETYTRLFAQWSEVARSGNQLSQWMKQFKARFV